jgi:RNA polymerase sigma factor (sigma-70 family)
MLINKFAFGARDKELLENELEEKVWRCWERFDPERGVKFDTFCNGCLLNHIQVFIRREGRKKHTFVSRSLSLDEEVTNNSHDGNNTMTRGDLIPEPSRLDRLEETIFGIELDKVIVLLPPEAKDILCLLLQGYSITEASEHLQESRTFVKGVVDQCLKPLLAEMMDIPEEDVDQRYI